MIPSKEDVRRLLENERSLKYRDAARILGFDGDPGKVRKIFEELVDEGVARKVMDGTRNFHFEIDVPTIPVPTPEPTPEPVFDEALTIDEAPDDSRVWVARRRGKKLGEVAELSLGDGVRFQIVSPWDPKTFGSLSEAFAAFPEKAGHE